MCQHHVGALNDRSTIALIEDLLTLIAELLTVITEVLTVSVTKLTLVNSGNRITYH